MPDTVLINLLLAMLALGAAVAAAHSPPPAHNKVAVDARRRRSAR